MDSNPRFSIQSPHMATSWALDRTSNPHTPHIDAIEQQIRRTAFQNGLRSEFRPQGLWRRMGQRRVVFGDFEISPSHKQL